MLQCAGNEDLGLWDWGVNEMYFARRGGEPLGNPWELKYETNKLMPEWKWIVVVELLEMGIIKEKQCCHNILEIYKCSFFVYLLF